MEISQETNWETLPHVSKSLFYEDEDGAFEDYKIPDISNISNTKRVSRVMSSIKRIYTSDKITTATINNFNKFIIDYISMYKFHGYGSSYNKPLDLYEKYKYFIDSMCSTVIVFYEKVGSLSPELLQHSQFKHYSESMTLMIQSIYYFIGLRWMHGPCSLLQPFFNDLNKIFIKNGGVPILLKTGNTGTYECGRGVVWASYKLPSGEVREGVFIHKSVSTANNSVNTSIFTSGPLTAEIFNGEIIFPPPAAIPRVAELPTGATGIVKGAERKNRTHIIRKYRRQTRRYRKL